jgi:hypothetical protein
VHVILQFVTTKYERPLVDGVCKDEKNALIVPQSAQGKSVARAQNTPPWLQTDSRLASNPKWV